MRKIFGWLTAVVIAVFAPAVIGTVGFSPKTSDAADTSQDQRPSSRTVYQEFSVSDMDPLDPKGTFTVVQFTQHIAVSDGAVKLSKVVVRRDRDRAKFAVIVPVSRGLRYGDKVRVIRVKYAMNESGVSHQFLTIVPNKNVPNKKPEKKKK